jgi:hypothetical protein
MKPYIPKQPKHARERIEAKLDEGLVRQLERYSEYLDSDRDYVLTQALEIVFRKDRGFDEWLDSQSSVTATPSPNTSVNEPTRRGGRPRTKDGTKLAGAKSQLITDAQADEQAV